MSRLPHIHVSPERLDATAGPPDRLRLVPAPGCADHDLELVVDLYLPDRPVHPAGHVGWWSLPLDPRRSLEAEVSVAADGTAGVRVDGDTPAHRWENPERPGRGAGTVDVHVALRRTDDHALVCDRVVRLYRDPEERGRADERRAALLATPQWMERSCRPWFVTPATARVHVVAPSIREGDAVGNLAIDVARLVRAAGGRASLWADHYDATLRGPIRDVADLPDAVAPGDVLFYQYSIGDPHLDLLAALPCRKVALYQGVTPPRLLLIWDAERAQACERGLAEAWRLADFDVLLASSRSTAADLHAALGRAGRARDDVAVCPPALNLRRWEEVKAEPVALPEAGTRLLYVGRVAPHKRVEHLFGVLEALLARDPDAVLVVAGAPGPESYVDYLDWVLANRFAGVAERVVRVVGPSDGQLKALYASCQAFVTASDHEGYCIPLAEAMASGLPVFAHGVRAVRETLGRAGQVFHRKDPEALAAGIDTVLRDPARTAQVVSAQHERFEALAREADGRHVWAALERAWFGPAAAGPRAAGS